jgi:acetyltransferase-like isoleucine patch superfamily enzyme
MEDKKVRGREKFQKYSRVIGLLIKGFSILPEGLRVKIFENSRMITGKKGIAIRYILLKTLSKRCGDNVSIHPNVYLFATKNLTIGSNVSIHPMCYIDATGDIEIGNDVSIAHSATIMSTEHIYDNLKINIKDQGIKNFKTSISSNVWIGSGSRILAGTNINEGSIIAAGAVVKGEVKKNSIYGGVPAKFIKER